MPYNVKEVVANKPSRFTSGHRMCAGCGAPPAARMIMRSEERRVGKECGSRWGPDD